MITNNIGTIGAHRAQTAAYWRRCARQTRKTAQIFHRDSTRVHLARVAVEFESFALRAEKTQQNQHC